MFSIGTWELIVILALALIILGPKKLPEAARSLGRGLARLRHSLNEARQEMGLDELKKELEQDEGLEELRQTLDVRSEIRSALDVLPPHVPRSEPNPDEDKAREP